MLALIALLVYEQVYKSIWNTIAASIAAFRFPSYPPVIIALIRAISIRIIGIAHIITL